MKHIYTQSSAATTLQSATSALGTALSGKIFTLLLLSFFLLVSGKGMAQIEYLYGPNDFEVNSEFIIQNVTRGSIVVSEGELRATTINGTTPGYNGYVVINTQLFKLSAGSTYTISFQARANNQNNAAVGSVEVLRGSSIALAGSNNGIVLGRATIAKSLNFSNYSISFTASSTANNEYIALRLTSAQEQNSHLYLDNLLITETCVPQAPQVAPVSSCSPSSFTLTVLNSEGNETYRWFDADQNIITGQTKSTLETPELQVTTNYYVARVNGTCESERVLISALIGKANAPKVASTENCPSNDVILIASGAGEGDSYRWYDVKEGGQPIAYTESIERKRANQYGTVYATIIKADGCESDRVPVNILKNNESPAVPIVESISRCRVGRVELQATGAVDGETYLWYTNPTGGTAIASGPKFISPILPEGASITYYVSKLNSALGCESLTRATVTASANAPIIATGTISSIGSVSYGAPATFEANSNVMDNGHATIYRWYMRQGAEDYKLLGETEANIYYLSNVPNDYNGIRVEIDIAPSGCYDVGYLYAFSNETITPLPVELTYFNARRHTQGVMLTWETASELENKGFEVQVSENARTFSTIGFVESNSSTGTTLMKQNYSFLDKKAVSGTRYYRLKQIDFDGTTAYSPVKAVVLNDGNNRVSAYPNPFDDAVVVTLNGTEARNVQVKLMDAMGKVIQQRTEETSGNSITVDTRSITSKGMYVLHVYDNDTKHTFKLMKR